jgi:proteasome lid subunit RPN8/RPN11
MDTAIKNSIYTHAESEYPRECCGLLVDVEGAVQYFPCRNQAVGTDNFILHPEDYAAADALGSIVAVVHSHPNDSPNPSQADRVACEASGLPWHIVSWPGQEWAYMEPEGYQAPLIGRVWSHGVLDCYSLIRDWYRIERGIILPDFDRNDDWWHKGQNLYVDNFQGAGFYRVMDDQLLPGDVLLMQVLANVPNHGAIYLGDGIILHHLHRRLSSREVYGGYYRKHCTHVLRYGNPS